MKATVDGRPPATFDPRLSDLRLLGHLSETLLTSRSHQDPGISAVKALATGETLDESGLRVAISTAHAVRDALLPLTSAKYWRISGLPAQDAVSQAERYRLLRDDWLPAQIAALHRP